MSHNILGDNVKPSNLFVPRSSTKQLGEDGGADQASPSEISATQNQVAIVSGLDGSPPTLTSHDSGITSFKSTNSAVDPTFDVAKPPTSRMFPNLLSEPPVARTEERPSPDTVPAPPSSTPFHPPPGSRLLAFGARNPTHNPKTQASLNLSVNGPLSDYHGGGQSSQTSETTLNHSLPSAEPIHAQQGFSPFEDHSRSYTFEESRENRPLAQQAEAIRRSAEPTVYSDTATSAFSASAVHLSSDPANGHGNPGAYATSKGSRFAKFFDGKARERQPPMAKAQNASGFHSSSPCPGQKQEASGFNGMPGVNGDHKAMDDIFAMLNNSTQACLFPFIHSSFKDATEL